MTSKVDLAVDLMVELAKSRTIPDDYVSRLYQVEMEVLSKINQLMADHREQERQKRDGGVG